MLRQIVLYLPANIIPALCSFLIIFVYTRLLTPDAFGVYMLVFSAVLVAQTALFIALPIAIQRFHPAAVIAHHEVSFLKSAYILFYLIALGSIAACLAALPWIEKGWEIRATAWVALPLLLSRAAVAMNQAVNRSANRMGRYNVIECTHAVLGLGVGLALIPLVGRSAETVLLGLLSAALVCLLIDVRQLVVPLRRRDVALDRQTMTHLLQYAWPLVVVAITASLLQLSDRFLLDALGGAGMLGVYAVAYSLVERPTSLICSAISTVTFPLAAQTLERDGHDAGRIQAGKNGVMLLAVTLPACVGLALTAPQIASVLVGPAFREGVATLIPIMAVTALLHGVRAHFVDHAFHLAGRSMRMLWSYGPAAAANLLLNLLLIPHFGMIGSAWTGLACQALAVLVGWTMGRRVFPLSLPIGQVARIAAAVCAMAAVLWLGSFPIDGTGLLASVSLGGATFLLMAGLLNVGGILERFKCLPFRRQRTPAAALSASDRTAGK